MSQSGLHRHIQNQQSNLMTLGIGLALFRAVTQIPDLSGVTDWGFFAATVVVLVHWHYGANYVLYHVGPTSDPLRTLWDAGMLVMLTSLANQLQSPVAWFIITGGSYFLAWVKYSLALRQKRYQGELRDYMVRKSWVEVGGFVLSWIGAASQWLLPQFGALYAWGAVVINIAFIYVMTRHFGFYKMGWNPDEWDLDQPT